MINISLHIRKLPPATGGGGGLLWSELWSTQIWSLHLGGGGGGVLWSELWSTQIWSLHFGGGCTLIWTLVNLNLKSSLGGGGVLWSELWWTQIWHLHFEGGRYSGVVKTQSAKICLNFNFRGGGGGGALWSEIPERGSLENLDTNLLCVQKPACASQISLSHTTYVETNEINYGANCRQWSCE